MILLTNCDRDDTVKAMVINFDEWPSKDKPIPATGAINGYYWRKNRPDAEWCLVNKDNDTISKAEFHVAYFEAIRMEHHFDQKFIDICAKMLEQSKGNKKGYEVTLTRAQVRAMCHALSEYDRRKDKLDRINEAVKKLNRVLTQ